jgi:glycosyltransferase involved in cell wall biosynthesis
MSLTFSVITVCYNAREVLPGTVATLAHQTYRPREWVVVDGGSKDGTQDYVHAAPEPLGPYLSEKDKGIYDAMNKAIALSTGDVLFFLNADDAFHDPEVLADVAREFEADPDLDMLWGDIVSLHGEERIAKRFDFINRTTIDFEDLCHQCIFARKRLFDRVGNFSLDWPTSADYDWVLRVFRSGAKVKYVRRPMALFKAGGAHVQNPKALADERRRLRLQYVPAPLLSVGTFISRAVHKLSRMTTGYAYGERSVS